MGHKIFTSYKYSDYDVEPLGNGYPTSPRGYVNKFRDDLEKINARLDGERYIFKGEPDGRDRSSCTIDYIKSVLADLMYDSSVTVLFISPNMKTPIPEEIQWIPWEIRYSIKNEKRENSSGKEVSSLENAIVAVILPNRMGSYDYYDDMRVRETQFRIVQENIDNGYIRVVRWSYFAANIVRYIEEAIDRRDKYIGELYIPYRFT